MSLCQGKKRCPRESLFRSRISYRHVRTERWGRQLSQYLHTRPDKMTKYAPDGHPGIVIMDPSVPHFATVRFLAGLTG